MAAESLEGPFLPISAGPATPRDWSCLDGTFYVENGAPYMVFCHEWEQIQNGSICAVLLSGDLTRAVGKPVLLFHASDAPWVTPFLPGCYVTDGPFLYQGQNGRLFMLWSSFHNGSYAIGAAWSDHGVLGPWQQNDAPIFCGDGGHGMLFKTLEGQLTLAIHTPNATPAERAVFLPVSETETGFCLL